jgi:hypothetical protein
MLRPNFGLSRCPNMDLEACLHLLYLELYPVSFRTAHPQDLGRLVIATEKLGERHSANMLQEA